MIKLLKTKFQHQEQRQIFLRNVIMLMTKVIDVEETFIKKMDIVVSIIKNLKMNFKKKQRNVMS